VSGFSSRSPGDVIGPSSRTSATNFFRAAMRGWTADISGVPSWVEHSAP
jgi:hypothetical protein